MSEPYMPSNGIIEPKSHRGWVVFAIIVIAALGFFVYNQYLGEDEDRTTYDTSQPAVNVNPMPAADVDPTPEPVPTALFDEDTARDLCWGDSLPGVQTSVPSGMSVYDGLGVDKGMRICMTPGEYARYEVAATKQLAAEQEVRDYVGEYTADDTPKSILATAAVAYLCALDAPSDLQYRAARAVFAELAGQSASFSATRDAMCGNHSQPTPTVPADPKSPVTTDDPGR